MSRFSWACVLAFLISCGPGDNPYIDSGGPGTPDGAMTPIDAPMTPLPDATPPPPDAPPFYPDAEVFPDGSACGNQWMCMDPLPDGCTPGPDICDDGADNNCDGQVDENCPCTAGAVQSCFRGQPGYRNVGACQDGMQTCIGQGEFTYWGPCTGGIAPSSEVCDGLDNACNGCVDDHPDCCDVPINCPGPGDLPDGSPFNPYVIDGTMFYTGQAMSWQWTVDGGPCDQVLGNTSFTLSGQNTDTLTITPSLSGDYTVTLTVVTIDGEILECTFIVHIAGPGLRVELCWDTTGNTDLDLHVHRDGTTTPWFTTTLNGSTVNTDDCYYRDCKGTVFGSRVDWGPQYTTSPLSECQNGPDGADWIAYGACHNPRLDVDNISTPGIPENVNVDNPLDGSTYRTMVHFYGGSQTTHPVVNIYCGGVLTGSYGTAPNEVQNFNTGGGFGAGLMWRVVDATTQVDMNGVTTGCNLTPLHPPGMMSGYWVTNNDRSY